MFVSWDKPIAEPFINRSNVVTMKQKWWNKYRNVKIEKKMVILLGCKQFFSSEIVPFLWFCALIKWCVKNVILCLWQWRWWFGSLASRNANYEVIYDDCGSCIVFRCLNLISIRIQRTFGAFIDAFILHIFEPRRVHAFHFRDADP